MTKEAKEQITQSGATLFNFHLFACANGRAMYVPLNRKPDGTPIKPFIVHAEEVNVNVPQWQLTWGAGASMVVRKVIMPSTVGLL